jgi:hypothetical protein
LVFIEESREAGEKDTSQGHVILLRILPEDDSCAQKGGCWPEIKGGLCPGQRSG